MSESAGRLQESKKITSMIYIHGQVNDKIVGPNLFYLEGGVTAYLRSDLKATLHTWSYEWRVEEELGWSIR